MCLTGTFAYGWQDDDATCVTLADITQEPMLGDTLLAEQRANDRFEEAQAESRVYLWTRGVL